MEKPDPDDQKAAARLKRVESQLSAHPALFASQGAVLATWRTYRGGRLGPYFRVSWRDRGRQRSIYLGRCEELARRVRALLARIHRPRRERRRFERLKAQVRASLRRCKARLKEELELFGIQLKGFEFRGAARPIAARSPTGVSFHRDAEFYSTGFP